MSSLQPINAQCICENLLHDVKRYNIQQDILRSENVVIDRLLKHTVELRDAYVEIYKKLHEHPPALQVFLGLVLSTAAFWNPEKMKEARTAARDLANVNQRIARKATELGTLLEQRSYLHNTSGFSSDTHHSICEVIASAAQDNYLFKFYVEHELSILNRQFDLKYWPSLNEFVLALALDAEKAVLVATDPLTAASTVATRPSLADFFKVLFVAIEENSAESYGQLPRGFTLTDRTLASLANCALDLEPDGNTPCK